MAGDEEGDTLGDAAKEIAEYATINGFTVFPAVSASGALNISTFKWDNKVPWKNFIHSAKKQGVSTIVARVRVFTNDDLNVIKTFEEVSAGRCDADSYDYCQHGVSKFSEYDILAKNVGKVGSFSVLWIDGCCGYSLEEVADWFKPVAAYFTDYDDDDDCKEENSMASLVPAPASPNAADGHYYYHHHRHLSCHCCCNRPELIGLPKGLRGKTIEDLAQEYAGYIKARAPELGYGMRTYIRDMFWEEKGVHRNALSSAARFLIKSVEVEASKILKRLEQEQEVEHMSAVVEECVKWCKENGISKLTLKTLGAFMSAKRIRLSVNSKDILFLKVSSRLTQPLTKEGA